MNALIIFNHLNDIAFLHCDIAFKKHILEKAASDGLQQGRHSELDPNIVMQVFSPLIASQRFMTRQMKNAYESIELEEGLQIVFQELAEYILVAISGDNTTSKQFLHRKLATLQRIIKFLFGPVYEELRPNIAADRKARWNFIGRLMDTWCELYHSEQSFLVEAIERLHVNQLLNRKCIELLESTLASIRTAKEKNAVHALIIINSKLLALYSSRRASELKAPDILLMILLVKTIYPSKHRLEDLFSQSFSDLCPPSGCPDSQTQKIDSEDSEEFHSTPSTPRESPTAELDKENQCSDTDGTSRLSFASSTSIETTSDDSHQECISRQSDSDSQNHSKQPMMNIPDVSTHYKSIKAMLGTNYSHFSPHTLSLVEAMPGIVIILVSEIPKQRYSEHFDHSLQMLDMLLNHSIKEVVRPRDMIEAIENNLRKINDLLRKIKSTTRLDYLMTNILEKWENIKRNNVLHYLEKRPSTDIPPELESPIYFIIERLKELFRNLFLAPTHLTPDEQSIFNTSVKHVRQLLHQHLWDYKDYLTVKAERNIAITGYVEEYPGLVHFIYLDRNSHQIVAPSLNLTSDDEDVTMKLQGKIKEKIWKYVPKLQLYLHKGYLMQSFRDSDLLVTYFLWFEDFQGIQVPLQHPYQSSPHLQPGMLAGNFYRHVRKQCIPGFRDQSLHCFELITIHLASVPFQLVLKHCRQLSAALWEATGDSHSPAGLL